MSFLSLEDTGRNLRSFEAWVARTLLTGRNILREVAKFSAVLQIGGELLDSEGELYGLELQRLAR